KRRLVARGLGGRKEQIALHALAQDLRHLESGLRRADHPIQVSLLGEVAMVDARFRARVARYRLHDTLRFAVANLDVETVQTGHRENLTEHEGELHVVNAEAWDRSELEGRPDGNEVGRCGLAGIDDHESRDVVEQVLSHPRKVGARATPEGGENAPGPTSV